MGETDDFEWDDTKDVKNQLKHEFELVGAALLFDGRTTYEYVSPKSPQNEARHLTMAEVDGHVLFCVWTWRGDKRRIISLRIAHEVERRAYEKATRGS